MSDDTVFLRTVLGSDVRLDNAAFKLMLACHGTDAAGKRILEPDPVTTPETMFLLRTPAGQQVVIDAKTDIRRQDRAAHFLLDTLRSGRICAKVRHRGVKAEETDKLEGPMTAAVPQWVWSTAGALGMIGNGQFVAPEFEPLIAKDDPIDPLWERDRAAVFVADADLQPLLREYGEKRINALQSVYLAYAEAIVWIGTGSPGQLAIVHERRNTRGDPSTEYAEAILGMLQTSANYRECAELLRRAGLNGEVEAKVRRMDNDQVVPFPKSNFGTAEFEDFEEKVVIVDVERRDNRPPWYEPRFLTADILNVWPLNQQASGRNDGASMRKRGGRPPKRQWVIQALKELFPPNGVPNVSQNDRARIMKEVRVRIPVKVSDSLIDTVLHDLRNKPKQ